MRAGGWAVRWRLSRQPGPPSSTPWHDRRPPSPLWGGSGWGLAASPFAQAEHQREAASLPPQPSLTRGEGAMGRARETPSRCDPGCGPRLDSLDPLGMIADRVPNHAIVLRGTTFVLPLPWGCRGWGLAADQSVRPRKSVQPQVPLPSPPPQGGRGRWAVPLECRSGSVGLCRTPTSQSEPGARRRTSAAA